MRETLLTESLAGKIGEPNFDTSKAELIVLHYLDLSIRVKKEGMEAVGQWLNKSSRPQKIVEALQGVIEKKSPIVVMSNAKAQLRSTTLTGQELFETLVAKEGACLIAEKSDSFYLFEYLASLFGEAYYDTLKTNIRNLTAKRKPPGT